MASPFSLFRRHQKVMLAVVGVAAMVAFVFLDPVMRYLGGRSGGGQAANPVIVETRYGNLTASELEALRYQRQLVDLFLQRVLENAVGKQFGNANIDARWLTGAVQQQYGMWKSQIMGRSVVGPEAEAVETMVLAERAKQMGLVISDRSINDMIKQLSSDNLSADELQTIIKNLQPQRPITVPRLFDALRTELLASQYRQLFAQSLTDIPPAQRFEYYSRLNRRAKTEVMSLAVADFIGQVPDPSDAELKTFYDKYKDQFADPTSPEPGFKEPKRASFQYFKAGIEPLTEKLKPEVTEAEIAKYYEENKRNFPAVSLDDAAAGEKPAEGATEAKPAEADKPAEGEKPAEEDAAKPEEKPADAPAAEEKPAEPASETPAEAPAAPAEKPADAAPAEEKPAEEKPAESPQAAARSNLELRGAGQKFRLVSMQEKSETEPASEPAPSDPAPAAAETPAAAPATEEKPAEGKPADAPADAPAADQPADPGDEVVKEPAVPAEAQQFEPLEKVADTIRAQLAREKAATRLNDQFEDLSAQMRRFTDDYDVYTTEKGTNPKAQAPVPLNFAELAKGKDVEAFELKSVTPLQATKEDIGKSFRSIPNSNGGPGRSVPFIEFAYAETLPEFKPDVDQDAENNFYLFWKTAEEPSYVPPLDQVRDQVVRAWKMVKARDLAKKRGQEYAQQAESLKKPLAELFGTQAGVKVVEPAPFSWLTVGNVPSQPNAAPRLSEIDGLDQAGQEFMKTVFGLQPGGVGVAINEPEDTVFVVRVIEFEPSEEQLRDEFARENPNRYMAAARDDQFAIYEDWIADLNKDAKVHWNKEADARRQQADDEGEGEF